MIRNLLLALLLFPMTAMASFPIPEDPMWLNYPGGRGPGEGKLIVMVSADQEYRAEYFMPMLASILSKHHGFNCTVLTGVKDIWGLTDVYRTFPEGGSLPEGCTALVMGQPLIGREQGGADNPEKEPLPVVWIKDWKTTSGISISTRPYPSIRAANSAAPAIPPSMAR